MADAQISLEDWIGRVGHAGHSSLASALLALGIFTSLFCGLN